MRVFICQDLAGVYLAASAVVVAEDAEKAAETLKQKLESIHLPQEVTADMLEEISIDSKKAYVIWDGSY